MHFSKAHFLNELNKHEQKVNESLDESVNEFFSIDPDKQAEFIKKAWYDGLHAGRTTTGANSEKKWKQFAKENRIDESVNEAKSMPYAKARKLTKKLNDDKLLQDLISITDKIHDKMGTSDEVNDWLYQIITYGNKNPEMWTNESVNESVSELNEAKIAVIKFTDDGGKYPGQDGPPAKYFTNLKKAENWLESNEFTKSKWGGSDEDGFVAHYEDKSKGYGINADLLHVVLESVNEGLFDLFKRRKKEIKQKKPKNKYNPLNIGYDHPDFNKEFVGFSKDPEKEIDDAFKTIHSDHKKIKPLINSLIVDLEHVREMMTQQDMVTGNQDNKYYIDELNKYLEELESIDVKVRRGIW